MLIGVAKQSRKGSESLPASAVLPENTAGPTALEVADASSGQAPMAPVTRSTMHASYSVR